MLAWSTYYDFKQPVSASFSLSLYSWQTETGKSKARHNTVFQNAVKQAVPQTYRSCEAAAVNAQPACIYLHF